MSSILPVFDTGLHIPQTDLALEYLTIVKDLKSKTPFSVVKASIQILMLMRPALGREKDLREKLWGNFAEEMGRMPADGKGR